MASWNSVKSLRPKRSLVRLALLMFIGIAKGTARSREFFDRPRHLPDRGMLARSVHVSIKGIAPDAKVSSGTTGIAPGRHVADQRQGSLFVADERLR